MNEKARVIHTALHTLLRPLIRLLLRNGIAYGSFTEIVKQSYVDIASHEQEFCFKQKKQSDSRIAILTGLTRKEVKAVKQSLSVDSDAIASVLSARYNRAARVIHGWVSDPQFQDGWGEPAMLIAEGEGASFQNLVKKYSGDVPVRSILDELLRVTTIEKLTDGRLKLLQHAYVPQSGELEKLQILGTDVGLLIQTIDHNLHDTQEKAYFQRKVAYDNLPEEALPMLQEMVANQGQQFLEQINSWLSQQDRDNNHQIKGHGRKQAGVGVYFFEKDISS